MKRLNVTDWTLQGKSGSARSYHHKSNNRLMLKLFTGERVGAEHAKLEFRQSKAVEACDINIPKALELVEMDGKTGILYERVLNKTSISKLCMENPDRVEELGRYFANQSRILHSTKCTSDAIPSIREKLAETINNHWGLNASDKAKLMRLCDFLEDRDTCLHGNLHTGNFIIAGEIPYWIDLSAFSKGDPMFDLGSAYFFYAYPIGKLYYGKELHMTWKQLKEFWNAFISEYFNVTDQQDIDEITRQLRKYMVLFIICAIDFEGYNKVQQIILNLLIKWELTHINL